MCYFIMMPFLTGSIIKKYCSFSEWVKKKGSFKGNNSTTESQEATITQWEDNPKLLHIYACQCRSWDSKLEALFQRALSLHT